jgi:hypothetical protein
MDAPAPRAPVGSVVDAAKGVAKPRTWHAAAVGTVALVQADPPNRDCVVGHESPGEAASRDGSPFGLRVDGDAAVRGCNDSSPKELQAQEGPALVFGPRRGSEGENPKGVETPYGSDGTHTRPGPPGSRP